jgi:cell division protein FtsL
MLGAVYTHYALNDKFDRMAPGLIFSLLLLTRLVIYWQGKRSDLNIRNEKSTELKEKIEQQEEEDNNTEESVDEESEEEQKASNEKKQD